MKTKHSYIRQGSRRAVAQAMSDEMVELARNLAKVKYGSNTLADQNTFALGYMSSLLASVAASSPTAMKQLASALEFSKEYQRGL